LGYAEKRGDYWRGRYKIEHGKYGTVSDDYGDTIRFRTKREAERAANDEEAKVRAGRRRDPAQSQTTFGQFVRRWYAAQDLAASTLQNYKRHIEEHLLPTFEHSIIADLTATDVAAWEKEERALGYAESSIKTWRATLHLILADAVDEGLRDANPATRRRGRGKRAGRSRNRGPEKAVTNPLGILLLAERAALLSGRDDEFVAVVLMGYTGMRWGELVGLETQYVRSTGLRVEWQLYELDTGEFHRCPPKDDSHRTLDLPVWLFELVSGHITRTRPQPCKCHGLKYVFRGYGAANGAPQRPGPKLSDVARRAGVSVGTASAVLNNSGAVRDVTRAKVDAAVAELGYIRGGGSSGELAAHWRRNGFTTWLFRPAATGWYAKKAPQEARPVPVLADPWPGVPVRGRNATGRADSCWLPIAPRLTPHGLRHTHKTVMVELGIPPKLMDERMGHEDGSIQARYSHVTSDMRQQLVTGLTDRWAAALTTRREMAPGSPVATLDRLLRAQG
jgi:integrase